jgi:hypothetical protein
MGATITLNRVVRFARESLASIRGGHLEELLERHYREIAHFKDIALDIDWAMYEKAEEMGKLRCFSARIGGDLIGYLVHIVNHNPHYKGSLQAMQDVIFIAPERRGLFAASRLIAYADECLAAEGVQVVLHHAKAAFPMDSILRRNNYELIDTLWAKRLDRR